MASSLFFYFLAVVTTVGAIAVVAFPSPLYSVLALILTFLGLAGLYLSLHAQFVAIVQVIIYASAIMMLFLFVVMLINLGREEKRELRLPGQKMLGAIAGLALFSVLLKIFLSTSLMTGKKGSFPTERVDELGNTQVIGHLLLTDYVLPFQAMGVLLFVGIVGAVVLARRRSR